MFCTTALQKKLTSIQPFRRSAADHAPWHLVLSTEHCAQRLRRRQREDEERAAERRVLREILVAAHGA